MMETYPPDEGSDPEMDEEIQRVLGAPWPSPGGGPAGPAGPGNGDTTVSHEPTPANPSPGRRDEEMPTTIGRYQVRAVLGWGGQATVYRVEHPETGANLALKIAHDPIDVDSEAARRLRDEARRLRELTEQAPAVLARTLPLVIDFGFQEGRPFLVMEYIPGRNLRQVVEQARIAPRRAAALVAELCRVVAYLHAHGFIHLDINPKNVMIDVSGRPRLIDLGIAQRRDAWCESPIREAGGTPESMAPEQARAEFGRISPASDVFALGGVLYYLLANEAPFAAPDTRSALDRARRCDLDHSKLLSTAVPRRLGRICLGAMAAEPDGRPAAGTLAASLGWYVRGPRRLLGAAAVCVVLLLGAVTLLLLQPRHRPPEPPALKVNRRGVTYDIEAALPLQTGDWIQLTCELPRGLRPSVYWFDSDGHLTEMTGVRLDHSKPVDLLSFPAPPKSIQLDGSPGTELILVCAGQGSPVARADIERSLGVGRPWPALSPRTLLRLGRDGLELRGTRGPGVVGPGPLAGIHDSADRLRRDLRDRAAFLAGVAFPHVEGSAPGLSPLTGHAKDRAGREKATAPHGKP